MRGLKNTKQMTRKNEYMKSVAYATLSVATLPVVVLFGQRVLKMYSSMAILCIILIDLVQQTCEDADDSLAFVCIQPQRGAILREWLHAKKSVSISSFRDCDWA